MSILFIGIPVLLLGVGLALLLTRRGMHWGATHEETVSAMTGDEWLEDTPSALVRMTRAIDIDAPAAMVWPWLTQLGRGAGWYSWDLLDNGGRRSARHLVSWIPPPQLGDSTAVGYLRHLEPRRELVWWLDESPYLAATVRAVMAYRVTPCHGGDKSRLVVRIQGDGRGLGAPFVRLLFPIIDSIMACRQLVNLKRRAEWFGSRAEDPQQPETGRRDQFQLYQVIYASGEHAGVVGKEHAAKHRNRAFDDGVLARESSRQRVAALTEGH